MMLSKILFPLWCAVFLGGHYAPLKAEKGVESDFFPQETPWNDEENSPVLNPSFISYSSSLQKQKKKNEKKTQSKEKKQSVPPERPLAPAPEQKPVRAGSSAPVARTPLAPAPVSGSSLVSSPVARGALVLPPVASKPLRPESSPPAKRPTQTFSDVKNTQESHSETHSETPKDFYKEALEWKVKSLEGQLRTQEQLRATLPESLRMKVVDFNTVHSTDLIAWVYPKFIETMLELSGESYMGTSYMLNPSVYKAYISRSEALQDSYTFQRKVYEIENAIKSLENMKSYIGSYRQRINGLLVNHVRVTHNLEPILNINKTENSTSFQLGIMPGDSQEIPPSSSQAHPHAHALASNAPPSPSASALLASPASQNPKNSDNKKTESSTESPAFSPRLGIGRVLVTDTGAQVIQHIIENTPKIFPFEEYFGPVSIKSISDVMTYLSRLEGAMNDEIISLKREQSALEDPYMRMAYGIIGKLALEGFEPQAVLYRNTEKETKEYSGTIFYRNSKIPEKCQISRFDDFTQNKFQAGASTSISTSSSSSSIRESEDNNGVIRDLMVIAYSGSNSKADWEKNFKIMGKESSEINPLLWGYKVHQGIGEAFEQGYNDLGARIGELMLKYKKDALKYLKNCPNTRLELYIVTTGHSLGGGLSTLAAIAMKKFSKIFKGIDNLDVYVSSISFAAPPVFKKDVFSGSSDRYDWGRRAEDFIGRGNILRVFVDRDPVATFSLFRENPLSKHRSFIMALGQYKQIGVPLMLRDVEGFFGDLSFWRCHLISRYGLLLSLFSESYDTLKQYAQTFDSQTRMDALKKELDAVIQLRQALSSNTDASNQETLDTIQAQYMQIQKLNALEEGKNLTVENVESLETLPENYALGQSQEKKVTFIPFYPDENNQNIFVASEQVSSLGSNTKCEPDEFWTEAIQGKYFLKSGQVVSEDIKRKLSCGCCLMKNMVLSHETLGTKARQALGQKQSIDSIQDVVTHCMKKQYCTVDMVEAQLKLSKIPNNFNAVSQWLSAWKGTALSVWKQKKIASPNSKDGA